MGKGKMERGKERKIVCEIKSLFDLVSCIVSMAVSIERRNLFADRRKAAYNLQYAR